MNLITSAMIFVVAGLALAFAFSQNVDAQSTMQMCGTMMNKAPKDVTIRTTSSQLVKAGQEANITILIKDKASNPLLDAQVPIMIERGSSMSTMDMMGSMTYAKELGSGKYQVTFTPDKSGVYTIHTHVIPGGKSMMAMMQNHMDIGIIAK